MAKQLKKYNYQEDSLPPRDTTGWEREYEKQFPDTWADANDIISFITSEKEKSYWIGHAKGMKVNEDAYNVGRTLTLQKIIEMVEGEQKYFSNKKGYEHVLDTLERKLKEKLNKDK